MSAYAFRLPDIGEGIAQAEITAWHVKPGDRVEEDQTLVDVMTDKATVDIASPVSGTVLAVHGGIGDMAPVGSVLVEFELAGDDAREAATRPVPEAPAEEERLRPAPAPTASGGVTPISGREEGGSRPGGTSRPSSSLPLASPATRRKAREAGVALADVPGTGPEGRITEVDFQNFLNRREGSGEEPVLPGRSGGAPRTTVWRARIVGLRRRIAERMAESARRIPHFTYVEEFDMTALERLRKTLNDTRGKEQPKLTLLPFFMQALVRLRPEFPTVNARFDDEAGRLDVYEGLHIGIATQAPAGLLVPVVRHAETLSLWDCARELSRVTAAARDGTATREELSGSTVTLTSLGPLGGIAATPIINHPEVAIVGPNKLVERPVVIDGKVELRTMMNLSASFDHRIVDGHEAARFVQRMKRLMEEPALLFIPGPPEGGAP